MEKNKRIKIDDIAKLVGYSTGTVSRAINNRPDISEKTRRKILKTMEEVGYRPNVIAQSLASSQTHTVALIIPNNTTPFLSSIALAIDRELYSKNYDMVLSNTYWDPEIEWQKLMFSEAKCVDGIILKPCNENVERYHSLRIPIIIISHTCKDNSSFIDIENDRVGYIAAKHLLDCGYTRIAFIGGERNTSVVQQRFKGFMCALQERNILFEPTFAKYGDYSIECGYNNMNALMTLPTPPDAVFACSDTIALGVFQTSIEKGIDVPEQLGIVGVNNDEVGALPYVSLTTVDQSVTKMGELAARMMIEQIENGDEWKPQKVLLYPELIVRSTTRAIRK